LDVGKLGSIFESSFLIHYHIDAQAKQGYIARTQARQPYTIYKTAGFVLPKSCNAS
jgi:hypothetical protein